MINDSKMFAQDCEMLPEKRGAVSGTAGGEERRLSDIIELNLFRIAQEALTNTRRHSQATEVKVSLVFTNSRVRLEIVDNGVGFPTPPGNNLAAEGKLGLIGIAERARLIGGSVRVETAIGKGTIVATEVPINKAD